MFDRFYRIAFDGQAIIFKFPDQCLVRIFISGNFLQQGIFFHLLIDRFHKFLTGQLQQLDGLLELRGHDQLLGKF